MRVSLLRKVIIMQTTARFILSKNKMLSQYHLIRNAVDHVSYSFKTNPVVGKELEKATDCWFSVHGIPECSHIADKQRVLFFAQAWNGDEISLLLQQGVRSFVVDNHTDLQLLLSVLEVKKTAITLFLRMKLREHTIHTGKHFVFGFSADHANALIQELSPLIFVEKLGIHFHRKTQNISEWEFQDELQQSLTPNTLQQLDYVNIGGGIPVDYNNSPAQTQQLILSRIQQLHVWLQGLGITCIAEPGRFIAAPCIELHTTIRNVYDSVVVVDASIYNAAMDTFIAHVRLKVKEEVSPDKGEAYTIKGCTPDSVDIFRYQVFLVSPHVGDTITFLNAGAYNFKTDFCFLQEIPTEVRDA